MPPAKVVRDVPIDVLDFRTTVSFLARGKPNLPPDMVSALQRTVAEADDRNVELIRVVGVYLDYAAKTNAHLAQIDSIKTEVKALHQRITGQAASIRRLLADEARGGQRKRKASGGKAAAAVDDDDEEEELVEEEIDEEEEELEAAEAAAVAKRPKRRS